MSRIEFDANDVQRLEYLRGKGYPDSPKIPMEAEEIKALRIGTACYVISTGYPSPRLMMFLGFYAANGTYQDEFCFCGDQGKYFYKEKNVGKTYNVFRTM